MMEEPLDRKIHKGKFATEQESIFEKSFDRWENLSPSEHEYHRRLKTEVDQLLGPCGAKCVLKKRNGIEYVDTEEGPWEKDEKGNWISVGMLTHPEYIDRLVKVAEAMKIISGNSDKSIELANYVNELKEKKSLGNTKGKQLQNQKKFFTLLQALRGQLKRGPETYNPVLITADRAGPPSARLLAANTKNERRVQYNPAVEVAEVTPRGDPRQFYDPVAANQIAARVAGRERTFVRQNPSGNDPNYRPLDRYDHSQAETPAVSFLNSVWLGDEQAEVLERPQPAIVPRLDLAQAARELAKLPLPGATELARARNAELELQQEERSRPQRRLINQTRAALHAAEASPAAPAPKKARPVVEDDYDEEDDDDLMDGEEDEDDDAETDADAARDARREREALDIANLGAARLSEGGKKTRKRRTKKSRTIGGKKSRKLRKRTTLKGGKRKRRRTRRRR